jgi:hypothetical protein
LASFGNLILGSTLRSGARPNASPAVFFFENRVTPGCMAMHRLEAFTELGFRFERLLKERTELASFGNLILGPTLSLRRMRPTAARAGNGSPAVFFF